MLSSPVAASDRQRTCLLSRVPNCESQVLVPSFPFVFSPFFTLEPGSRPAHTALYCSLTESPAAGAFSSKAGLGPGPSPPPGGQLPAPLFCASQPVSTRTELRLFPGPDFSTNHFPSCLIRSFPLKCLSC